MKILHTSDWHLGHVLYGYDRYFEQSHMLGQIERIVAETQPDVMIISGDIFHTSAPSAAVQRMFTESMVKLHDISPGMKIVIIAGNHDSASRHEISKSLWKHLGVSMIGTIDVDNPLSHIIEVSDKGWIVAVPYAHRRNMPDDFFSLLQHEVKKLNTKSLPVILSAHTTIADSDVTGHDEEGGNSMVGGIESVELEEIGTGYDYVALGHIHKPQTIKKDNIISRYCGTPLAVSFDEKYPHSVSLVEIEEKGQIPEITEITIENVIPLLNIPPEGWAPLEEVIDLIKTIEDDAPAYLRLNVTVEDFLPVTAQDDVMKALNNKKARFCLINPKKKEEVTGCVAASMTFDEFVDKEPLEIIRKFSKDLGIDFDKEFLEMYSEVLSRLEDIKDDPKK